MVEHLQMLKTKKGRALMARDRGLHYIPLLGDNPGRESHGKLVYPIDQTNEISKHCFAKIAFGDGRRAATPADGETDPDTDEQRAAQGAMKLAERV